MARIGRVAVRRNERGKGFGKKLMLEDIRYAEEPGFASINLDAQISSIPFYGKLGFVGKGEIFDDAGIPHRHMTLKFR
ncbi:MAG: GNAT family N-acetyltransferase [Pseudomonadota bacterium]|nr:GNAT family N-acetyltransferase [Pseudomonadota bacterium]